MFVNRLTEKMETEEKNIVPRPICCVYQAMNSTEHTEDRIESDTNATASEGSLHSSPSTTIFNLSSNNFQSPSSLVINELTASPAKRGKLTEDIQTATPVLKNTFQSPVIEGKSILENVTPVKIGYTDKPSFITINPMSAGTYDDKRETENKKSLSTTTITVVKKDEQQSPESKVRVLPGTDVSYRTPGAHNRNKRGQVKRPMNAFMCWARSARTYLCQKMPHASNSDISVKLGHIWSSMTQDQKQPYYDESDAIKRKHQEEFPDWIYQPNYQKRRDDINVSMLQNWRLQQQNDTIENQINNICKANVFDQANSEHTQFGSNLPSVANQQTAAYFQARAKLEKVPKKRGRPRKNPIPPQSQDTKQALNILPFNPRANTIRPVYIQPLGRSMASFSGGDSCGYPVVQGRGGMRFGTPINMNGFKPSIPYMQPLRCNIPPHSGQQLNINQGQINQTTNPGQFIPFYHTQQGSGSVTHAQPLKIQSAFSLAYDQDQNQTSARMLASNNPGEGDGLQPTANDNGAKTNEQYYRTLSSSNECPEAAMEVQVESVPLTEDKQDFPLDLSTKRSTQSVTGNNFNQSPVAEALGSFNYKDNTETENNSNTGHVELGKNTNYFGSQYELISPLPANSAVPVKINENNHVESTELVNLDNMTKVDANPQINKEKKGFDNSNNQPKDSSASRKLDTIDCKTADEINNLETRSEQASSKIINELRAACSSDSMSSVLHNVLGSDSNTTSSVGLPDLRRAESTTSTCVENLSASSSDSTQMELTTIAEEARKLHDKMKSDAQDTDGNLNGRWSLPFSQFPLDDSMRQQAMLSDAQGKPYEYCPPESWHNNTQYHQPNNGYWCEDYDLDIPKKPAVFYAQNDTFLHQQTNNVPQLDMNKWVMYMNDTDGMPLQCTPTAPLAPLTAPYSSAKQAAQIQPCVSSYAFNTTASYKYATNETNTGNNYNDIKSHSPYVQQQYGCTPVMISSNQQNAQTSANAFRAFYGNFQQIQTHQLNYKDGVPATICEKKL